MQKQARFTVIISSKPLFFSMCSCLTRHPLSNNLGVNRFMTLAKVLGTLLLYLKNIKYLIKVVSLVKILPRCMLLVDMMPVTPH